MGKQKKSAIKNEKKLIGEVNDSKMAYMKRQLKELNQISSNTLPLITANIGTKNSKFKTKHINNHQKPNKNISDSKTNISNNQKEQANKMTIISS